MTSCSQVSSNSLLILYFILENLEAIGSPTRLLYKYIRAFIAHDDVAFEEVMFNLGDIEQCAAHEHVINQLVQHLSVNPP